METTIISDDRRRELCTKVVRLTASCKTASMRENIRSYTGWTLIYPITNFDGIATTIELGIASTDFLVKAHAQGLIDGALHSIAEELAGRKGLFDRQVALRNEIEENVINRKKVASGSVTRNRMRDFLARERKIAVEIEEKKIAFDELLAAAKELGFEVFERGENRFHIYLALEVSYVEIVNDLKVRQVEMEHSSALSSLPPA